MVQGDDVTSAANERDSIFERTANRLCLPGQGASGQLRDHFAGARFLLGSKLFGCQENVAIDVECGAHASDVTTSNSCVNCVNCGNQLPRRFRHRTLPSIKRACDPVLSAANKLRAQPGGTALVPNCCFSDVSLRLVTRDDWQTHKLARIRSRATSHGVPPLGWASNASNRRSSSAICSGVRPNAGESSAMLSHKSSTS